MTEKKKRKITLQDTIDYVKVWHGTPLSDREREAVCEVCKLGEQFGYGNMIAWLNTAWAISLINENGIDPEKSAKMIHGVRYPLPDKTREGVK